MVPRHRDGLVTKDEGFTESFTRLKAFAPAKILAFWSTFVVSRSCRSQFSKSSLGRWTDCWVFWPRNSEQKGCGANNRTRVFHANQCAHIHIIYIHNIIVYIYIHTRYILLYTVPDVPVLLTTDGGYLQDLQGHTTLHKLLQL